MIQNEIFSQILHGLDAIVLVIDMKTHEIIFINAYGQDIWGDITGKICWQTIPASQTGPCDFCTNSRLVGPDGKPSEGVVWQHQHSANNRWYETRDRAIFWPDGRLVRMEVATDITERKQSEENARRDESRLRKLVDILQHPATNFQDFLDYALDQAILLTESRFGYIYHYHENRREFVLNTWSRDVMAECTIVNPSICYELDKTGIWGEAIRQRRTIVVNDFQADNPLKKGYPEGHVQLFRFMTVPIFSDNRIVGVIGLANKETDYAETDILQVTLLMESVWKVTARMIAEDALRANQQQLMDMIEFLPDATLVIDRERRVVIWNKAIEKMTNVPAAEIIGKGGYAYAVPFYHEARPILLDLLFDGNGDPAAIYPGVIRDADALTAEVFCPALYHDKGAWIYSKASLLRGPSGSIIGAIQSLRDITDRKRAEEKLLHINETLEKRVEQEVQKNLEHEHMLIQQSRVAAMGEMINNIAHQWRQPLNALGLLLYNIRDEYRFNSLDAAYLDQAVADGTRMVQKMSATISGFSNFFHPNTEIQVFSAREQIRKTVDLVEESFQNDHISIHIDAPDEVMLLGFPNEYSQVMLHMLSNARETILLHNQGLSGRVYMVLTEQGNQGCVRVCDTGGGIPADILGRIFEPYFSTKGKGSGIGLYLSKMIIERSMNGSITAKNIEGGAEFRVCVPLADEPLSASVPDSPA